MKYLFMRVFERLCITGTSDEAKLPACRWEGKDSTAQRHKDLPVREQKVEALLIPSNVFGECRAKHDRTMTSESR